MGKNEKKADTSLSQSKSMAKREERKKEVAKNRRNKRVKSIIGWGCGIALAAVIIFAIGINVYRAATRTVSSSDFSAVLNSNGLIEGVDTSAALTLADYENLTVPMDEVSATTEEVDNRINSTLESYAEFKEDTSLTVATDDVVNIDYVGTIDGVEFEGGNSNGEGYELTIGSGSFIDNFEDQLIGTHPGDNVKVNVTFPEDYSDANVAGKPAVFDVTVHSIKVTPELTDEFVAENFADTASTVEEYKKSIEDEFYKQHLEEYITKFITENSTVKSYPAKYLKNIKSVTKYNDESMMAYYNQMFSSYGMDAYKNVWELRGEEIKDEISYEKELTSRAKEAVKDALIYQAIYEKAGLSIDMDKAFADMTEQNSEEYVTNMKETYGEGYLAQAEIKKAVTEYLNNTVKVN
ncbi:MAG: FKBP-type peptidyl-prolyl cis-trans isomerase [Lachnospiraceae bacterium]|nr:FKBP-type peptidyl-prolyl cis-trans isomerase [Lachnospiraceae bacterium]